jgi:hypothetical protein
MSPVHVLLHAQTIGRKFIIAIKLTICLYLPTPRDKAFSLINVFNFVLLGQLTFNYFKMHLMNNQLCLYLIVLLCLCLCLCHYTAYVRQELVACTPESRLVGYDHRSALFAFKTNLFIEKCMQHISGVIFFRLYFKSFKHLYAPKEILIPLRKSLNLKLCCYFKRMLIIN